MPVSTDSHNGSVHTMYGKDVDVGAAIIHVCMAIVVVLYIFATGQATLQQSLQHQHTLALSLSFLLYCIALILSNYRWPGPYVSRRILTMLVDSLVITLGLLIAGETALPFLGGYLWITIANGLRYGRNYLIATNLLCLLGFTLVMTLSEYWQDKLILGIGNLFWLALLPAYFANLLKKLQLALQQAQHANNVKNQFLANMSHELRTPLTAIIGYSEILVEDAQAVHNTASIDDLHKIQNAAHHLLTLINGILDLSKLEAGKMTASMQTFDLPTCIDEVVHTIAPSAQHNHNQIQVNYNTDIKTIYTDRIKLKQSLLNLACNANKFTEHGQITLTVTSVDNPGRGQWLQLDVSDTGIGIDAAILPRLFEPFEQADISTTRTYGGTGLGLTITKQFIELLGGSIHVSSTPSQGSVFSFSIPISDPDAQPQIDTETKLPLRLASNSATPDTAVIDYRIKSSRILLIMHPSTESSRIQHYLNSMRFELRFASSIVAALDIVRSEIPDVIVLDLQIVHSTDNIQLQEFKANLAAPAIPIIMLIPMQTAHSEQHMPATVCIRYPLDMTSLAAAIITQLRRASTPVQLLVISEDVRFFTAVKNVCASIHVATAPIKISNFSANTAVVTGYNTILLDLHPVNYRYLHQLKMLAPYRLSKSLRVICLVPSGTTQRKWDTLARYCDCVIQKSDFGLDETVLQVIDCINPYQNNYYARQKIINSDFRSFTTLSSR